MPVDFPLAALHRYLWDHLTEIIPATTATTRQQGQVFSSPGVSNAWATGAGYEGFDNFRVELEKFSGGQSNPTFMLFIHLSPPPALRPQGTPHNGISGANGIEATATRQPPKTEYRFVLRKKPASVNVSSAHAVEREFRVLRALQQTNVPVPDVLLLCEDLSIIGTPFYVMEFVNGRVFSDSSLPGMSRHDRFAAYASAAETLARIHGVDFVSVGLEGYGRSKGGYFGRQVATLERVAMKQAEDAGPIEGFSEVVQGVRDLSSSVPDRVTLVHGDFRIDNLVFHPIEPRVIAVLDWELSTLGHPLADLANLCILHHLPATPQHDGEGNGKKSPSPLAGLKGLDLETLGIPDQSELMDMYRATIDGREGRLAGVAGQGVAEVGLAFIFFKMAVIAHGVKARLSRGVASSSSASVVSAMVPVMMALANEQISKLREADTGCADDDENDRVGRGGERQGRHWRPKAVLFDVGGVLSESPLLAIARFERETRLPPAYIGVAIAAAGEEGLFQRLERGEERLGAGFLQHFSDYLGSDQAKQAYVAHVIKRSPDGTIAEQEAKRVVVGIVKIDVLELFRRIAAAAQVPVPEMIAAVEMLRRKGLKVAAVSNDFLAERGFVLGRPRYSSTSPAVEGAVLPNERDAGIGAAIGRQGGATDPHGGVGEDSSTRIGGGVYASLPALCDVVVLSSASGCRKPGRRIYEDACLALGVSASEAVFVDDIRANVRAAEELGMRAVWVQPGGNAEVKRAIAELQAMTGVKLVIRDGCDGARRPAGKL